METITNLEPLVCFTVGHRQPQRPSLLLRLGNIPHTLQYRPLLIDTLISNERINSYRSVFRPANDVELMGVYLWNTHVCGALYPLIGAVEVTLRNAIDQALATVLVGSGGRAASCAIAPSRLGHRSSARAWFRTHRGMRQ